MKKFLKIFALCAVFAFAVSIACSAQEAEKTVVTADKYNFRNVIASIKESCTLEIVGEIDTKTVKLMGDSLAKLNRKGISINLDMSKATGLEHIENWSLYDCGCLKSVILPSGVRIIGKGAFDGANCSTGLHNIIIPDTVKIIGDKVFRCCIYLEDVVLPNSLEIIGNYAFDTCWSLKNIVIPDSVRSIGNGAFYGCHILENITIGSNVENIGENAFRKCE